MGCFNKIGFYSHLPITYDNDIVYFICISKKYKNHETTPIAPFGILEPICLPIFGKYDDYGSICDIVRDNNVEYIEKCFNLTIEEIIEAIDTCGCNTINDLEQNERLNGKIFKEKTEKYKSILSKFKNHFKSIYYDFDDDFSLTFTMELLDVYNFACSEYRNEKSIEILNSILEFSKKYKIENINIFNSYSTSGYDDSLLDAINEYDSDKVKELSEKIKKFSELRELIFEYSRYNCFIHCSLNTLRIYDLLPFNAENNIDLINNFSSFCFCLMANCINFSPSPYGNQGILSECESMINMHKEFIKILKMKKKEYE